ncbi:hypothetical protein PybrP1_012371 [[Pythium] brassicae (nom. inval.)]|nr:hypothetical protein PybrP1_012371 [[Pythium] brassicae (nom. inval.)]
MGGGVSKPIELAALPAPANECGTTNEATRKGLKRRESAKPAKKETTAIDGRIVQTLQALSLKRSVADAKNMNFERIALKFGLAREAFDTIHGIYHQFACEQKGGLDYNGLKAALNGLGAHMNEKDMREIFYESDMVRDNSLSKNEFVVSLTISYLLGLITSFEHVFRAVAPAPEGAHAGAAEPRPPLSHGESGSGLGTAREPLSSRDTSVTFSEDSAQVIAKTLELMVTAYLLFDDDASGTIQVNEVRNIMRKHNSSTTKLQRKASGMNSKAIQVERIKELDVDQDGTITFQEFVLTFQKWVSSDDDDDDDDDDAEGGEPE